MGFAQRWRWWLSHRHLEVYLLSALFCFPFCPKYCAGILDAELTRPNDASTFDQEPSRGPRPTQCTSLGDLPLMTIQLRRSVHKLERHGRNFNA